MFRLVLLVSSLACAAPADRLARVEARIRPAMERHNIPGLSVAVVNGGKVDWARGYGVRRKGEAAAVTPDTLFQAASISKPVAALAALHMAQYGNFSLDEDVNLRLRSWKVPENEDSRERKVTLRGILSHSAGLTVHGFRGYAGGERVPSLIDVLEGRPPANSAPIRVDIVPGSKWRYSGGGYCVLEQLLSDRMGKPFPELMRLVVLGPLRMNDSTYEQPLPPALAARAAIAHDRQGRPLAGGWHTYPEHAAAGLWTTPSDLARFVIALQDAYTGRSNRVIEAANAREMLERQSGDYGLGVALAGAGESARFLHGGANAGFRCFMVGYRDRGIGVVVMTNSDTGAAAIPEVLHAVAEEYDWPGKAEFKPR